MKLNGNFDVVEVEFLTVQQEKNAKGLGIYVYLNASTEETQSITVFFSYHWQPQQQL